MSEVPESYLTEATGSSGSLEWFSYETQDYRDGAETKRFIKEACVYLPPGYSNRDKYNIVYLMHGWTGYAGEFFDNPDGHDPYPSKLYTVTHLKNVIDHMIEVDLIEPMIIVTPTFYPSPERSYMARDTFIVLNTLKSSDKPLRARQIAEITGLDCKAVFNAFYNLRNEGKIKPQPRCAWESVEL